MHYHEIYSFLGNGEKVSPYGYYSRSIFLDYSSIISYLQEVSCGNPHDAKSPTLKNFDSENQYQ